MQVIFLQSLSPLMSCLKYFEGEKLERPLKHRIEHGRSYDIIGLKELHNHEEIVRQKGKFRKRDTSAASLSLSRISYTPVK